MPLIDVIVAQVSRGQVSLDHLSCMHGLRLALLDHPLIRSAVIQVVNSGENIDKARSVLTSAAYQRGANVVLWVDDDILFTPSEIVEVVLQAHSRQSIVGAVAALKSPGAGLGVQFEGGPQDITFFGGGCVRPCHAIGTSLMAIPYEVLRQVAILVCEQHGVLYGSDGAQLFPFFLPFIEDGIWNQEDYAFCARSRACGNPLYVDTRVRLEHVGPYRYTVADSSPPPPLAESLVVSFTGEHLGTPLAPRRASDSDQRQTA